MKANEHIEKYLDYYCDFNKNLPFAVLLKGQWGCGKTFFIKDYIGKRKNKHILHISLYGVGNLKGIKEKIIAELLPLIPDRYSNITSKIINTLGRFPKIKDWIPDNSDELIVDFFLKDNKYTLVFDDLERCNIKIDILLGYINNFVEFKNQKVILISDEDKILKSECADKYREIKEKLIGKEFHINPSKEEAINLFVDGLQDKELKKLSENVEQLLLKIFVQSGYDNLRLMQQALSQFEYFYGSFSSRAKEDSELFERMFYEFIVIFVEYKKGEIKSGDFFKSYPHFFKKFDDKSKHFLDKYDGVSSWLTCFSVEIIGKILQGMSLSDEERKKMIDNFESLADINKESWQKLWYCYERSDEEFFENLKDVSEKWDNKYYKDLYVVLHVYGMLLEFSKIGFLQKSKDEIFKEGKEYIEYLIKEEKFPLDLHQQNAGFSWRDSAYGLQYSGMKNEEWNKLVEFIKEKIEGLKSIFIKNKIKNELMPVLKGEKSPDQNLDLYVNYNFLHYSGERVAYFQYIDVDEIAKILVEGETMYLRALSKVFKQRFENARNEIKNIEKEIPFLVKLKNKLEIDIENIERKFGDKKTPRTIMIRNFIDDAIKPFINDKKIMEKIEIKNRKGQKMVILIERIENQKGLAFVMHGLGGFKEQPHIETFASAFKEKGYTVVRFDTTNTFGESEGDYQDATTTNYYEDLEDVIKWAENQEWYQEPFILAGHSLGGISTVLYAEKYPEKIKGLAPISLVVSGKLWEEVHDKEQMKKWKEDGTWNKGESVSKPGAMKILKWNFAEDIMKYDVINDVDKLTMPILLIVGDKDDSTPFEHNQKFHDALSCKKEIHIIKNAEHTFREKEQLEEIKQIFVNWIDELN